MSSYSAPVISQPARSRTRWLKAIVLTTVLACNIAAIVGVWVWVWKAEQAPDVASGEDFSGVIIALAGLVVMATLVISLAIGLTVALVRFGRPSWLQTTSAARAVLIGLRTASWGLCAVMPIPVFFLTAAII